MRIGLDPRANHRPSKVTILVTAAFGVALMASLVILAAIAPRGVPLLSYYYVDAHFKNAENLKNLSAVDIGGRQVGQVSSITYKNGVADVSLQMLPGTQKLTSGATARIRLKNPIGAKYVEISASNAGTVLQNHDILPTSHTSTAVDTQTLLSGFPAPVRKNLTQSLNGLGNALLGRGLGINNELPYVPNELSQLTAVSNAILAIPNAASDFAPNADSLASAYDPVRTQLANGLHPEANVLQDFGDERSDLQHTLEVAPSSLGSLQSGLAKSDPLLEQTTGLAQAAIKLTKPAPAALNAATRLLKTSVPSLQRSLPLLHAVDNAVSPTLTALDNAYPILSPTTTMLKEQLAPLTTLDAHGCDFVTMTKNWRSAMSFGVPGGYDPTSNLSTLESGLGPDINSFRVLALAPSTTEEIDADAPGDFVHGTDGNPAPCQAVNEVLK